MSFRKAISQTLLFGQLLGLMPICGVSSDRDEFKFKWKTFKFFYCVVSIVAGIFILAFYSVFMLNHQKLSLGSFVSFSVYVSNFITLILFLRLTTNWPKLIQSWESVEANASPLDTNRLRQQLNLRLFVIVSSALSKSSFKSICEFLIEKFSSRVHFTNAGNFCRGEKV